MGNVIPAEGKFGAKNEIEKVNMFLVHRKPEDVVDYIEGAMSYRTEIIKPGHSEQFMVTGILFEHIAVSDDGYADPVKVIEIGDRYSRMAEAVAEYGNDQGLLNFITNGAVGLHLMVLGGCYENPSLPIATDIETIGPRMVNDPDAHPSLDTKIQNPETYGVSWGGLQSFIVGELLGQCCCGRPEDVLRFCHDAIEHLGMREWDRSHGELAETDFWKNRMAAEAKYGSGPLYYVWHNLENLDYLEHGSSAPGWLTGEGEHFLALMQIEIASNPEEYADGK